MNKIVIFLFIFLQILYSSSGHEVYEIAKKSTYRVDNIAVNYGGTGFIINQEGYLITNEHVINGYKAGKISISNSYSKYNNIKVVKVYPKKEIAILKINDYKDNEFLRLAKPKLITTGIKCYKLGYAGASEELGNNDSDTKASFKDGVISKDSVIIGNSKNDRKFEPGYKLLETSVPVNSGDSGGPLLSIYGDVLGVITIKNIQNQVENTAWAIHVEELIKVLDENKIKYTISDESLNENTNSVNIVYIVLLIAAIILLALISYILYTRKKTNEIKKIQRSRNYEQQFDKSVNKRDIERKNNHFNIVEDNNKNILREDIFSIKLQSQDYTYPEMIQNNKPYLTVGRSVDNDIVINNIYVSKKHLKVYINHNNVEVEDLNSSNGTYIDGRKLSPYQKSKLIENSKLIIGSEEVIYKIT